jgi:hypothetical protein
VQGVVDDKERRDIVEASMASLLAASDELLKKTQANNHLQSLIIAISHSTQVLMNSNRDGYPQGMAGFYAFWVKFTVKLMGCGAFVLRLYAWDLLTDLMDEARKMRPLASAYLVSWG